MNIEKFLNILNYTDLITILQKIPDNRKRPQVPLDKIILSVIISPFFERYSLNQIDAFHRTNNAKTFFQMKHRKMVASDSLIELIYKNLNPKHLKEVLGQIADDMIKNGLAIGIGGHRILSIDGSHFGREKAVVASFVSLFDCYVDHEAYTQGKEGLSTRMLIRRVCSKYPTDIVVTDGLGLNRKFFKTCRECDVIGFVKFTTKEGKEKPSIIRDADGILERAEEFPEVFYKKYTDYERMKDVEIWMCSGFELIDESRLRKKKKSGKKMSRKKENGLTVIRVREREIKSNQEREFYIITDGEVSREEKKEEGKGKEKKLNINEAREIAKGEGRWSIEINGFRELSQLFASKRKTMRDKVGSTNMLTSRLISLNILNCFLSKNNKMKKGEAKIKQKKEFCGLNGKSATKVNVMKLIHEFLVQYIIRKRCSIYSFIKKNRIKRARSKISRGYSRTVTILSRKSENKKT